MGEKRDIGLKIFDCGHYEEDYDCIGQMFRAFELCEKCRAGQITESGPLAHFVTKNINGDEVPFLETLASKEFVVARSKKIK